MEQRFLTVTDVAEVLNTSARQVYQLLNSGALVGLQMGDKRQWRIGVDELEQYIERETAATQHRIREGQIEHS